MSRSDKAMEEIQDQLRRWASKAGKDYPHQLESTLRNAVNHLDPAAIARGSEQLLATLGGNKKMVRKTRNNLERSLEIARQKLSGHQPRRSRAGLFCGAAALTFCIVGVWAWRAARKSKTVASAAAMTSSTDPLQSGTDTDPDMSNS